MTLTEPHGIKTDGLNSTEINGLEYDKQFKILENQLNNKRTMSGRLKMFF